jgi:predicted PurR-regulated permease PerM
MTAISAPARNRTSRAHFYAFLGALALASIAFLWMIAPFVLALFFGGLLAVIAHPFYDRARKKLGATAAAALSTALMLVVVLGPLAAFAVVAAREGTEVGGRLAHAKEFTSGELNMALARVPEGLGGPVGARAMLTSGVRSFGGALTAVLLNTAKSIPGFLLQLALGLVAFYFFLLDGRRFADFILTRAAFEEDVRFKLKRTFSDTARSTVLAGFAAAASQSAVILVAFLVLGVPAPYLAAAGTFVLTWLPVLGSFPASAAGVAFLFACGEPGRAVAMIAFGCLAGVVDNVARPLVLKGRGGMHPLLGVVAIIAGIDLCGILGIFIGPMIAAILVSLLDIWPEIGARFGVDVTDGAS